MTLRIQWCGPPHVTFKGERILFPFKKAEALFYYLAQEKRATRDRLLALLWADMEEASARKNLRNALYIIRKLISDDLILTPNRDIVEWNPEYSVDGTGKDEDVGEFLEGVVVKDAETYQEWLDHQRSMRRESERDLLHRRLETYKKENQADEIRACLMRMMTLDEYDEDPYRLLMQHYADSGQIYRGIEVYQELSGRLRRELEIQPEEQTMALYESLLREKTKLKQGKKPKNKAFFYGRTEELDRVKRQWELFLGRKEAQSLFIHGEAGIGKSELVKRFKYEVEQQDVIVFKTNCYATDENAYYRPWESIDRQAAERLGEHPTVSVAPEEEAFPLEDHIGESLVLRERELIDRLERIALQKPMVLVFEDIHWADIMTLNLITRLLIKERNETILLVLTSRTGNWEDLGQLLVEGRRENLLECLELRRFSEAETVDFANGYLKSQSATLSFDELYNETEGNPFFIVEYLKHLVQYGKPGHLTPRMQDVLLSRLARVRPEGQKILDLISVFRDRVPLGVLSEISGRDEMELIDLLDELYRNDLIKESFGGEGDVELLFTHQKLRDFVYDRLSEAKRRILVRRIADTLASRYRVAGRTRWDLLDYYYEKAGEKAKALGCGLNNLYGFLESAYETFPVLPGREGPASEDWLSEEEVGLKLKSLEERLLLLEKREGIERVQTLRMQWLHMAARYHIKIGSYVEGLKALEELKNLAGELKDPLWQVKAGFQEIFYCINAHRTAQMELVVDETLRICGKSTMEMETAILLRLKGFHRILVGDYADGDVCLTDSLHMFQGFGQPARFALNIAAVYYYLGESRRFREQWEEAQNYYLEAIRLCRDSGQIGRLTIFYTQAGHGAYESGNFEKAEEYLDHGLKLYTDFDFRWGRSTACGFQSLVRFRQGQYQESLALLKDAMTLAKRLGNPYEMGLCNRVRAEMRALTRQADLPQEMQSAIKEYIDISNDLPLEPLTDRCYEIDVTERMIEFSKQK